MKRRQEATVFPRSILSANYIFLYGGLVFVFLSFASICCLTEFLMSSVTKTQAVSIPLLPLGPFHVVHCAHNVLTCVVCEFLQGSVVSNRTWKVVHLPEMTIATFDCDCRITC